MRNSPGFSKFRELMDLWDEAVEKEEKQRKIRNVVDGNNLILFFKKGDGIYGAPEESRVVFAKMKTPDDEMPEGWLDDASFMAFDLLKAMSGQSVQNVFNAKDLDSIEVIEPEKVEDMLMSCPWPAVKVKQSKDGLGVIKLKDRNK